MCWYEGGGCHTVLAHCTKIPCRTCAVLASEAEVAVPFSGYGEFSREVPHSFCTAHGIIRLQRLPTELAGEALEEWTLKARLLFLKLCNLCLSLVAGWDEFLAW